MAIAIDEMIYSDHCDDELVYQYLYHLSYMLAVKNRYFNSAKMYDDFAIYTATSVFLRLKNKKQFQPDKNGNYKLTKIKSVLNYLKKTLYFRKVSFEQEVYSQTLSYEEVTDDILVPTYTFSNRLSTIAERLNRVEFGCYLETIVNVFKDYLKNIPYRYKSPEWYNIYISCLLTFLNNIILSYKDLEKLNNSKYRIGDIEMIKDYFNQNKDEVILYHLNENMKDYILILVRCIKHIIAKDLSEDLHCEINTYNLSDIIIYNELNGTAVEV